MKFRVRRQDTDTLHDYRIALSNALNQEDIAPLFESIGYTEEILTEGLDLLDKTKAAFHNYMAKKDLLKVYRDDFKEKRQKLEEAFELHRKKARLVYRNEEGKADMLAVSGTMPRIRSKWVEAIRKFYKVASADENIQNDLARAKLTREEIESGLEMIAHMEVAEEEYINAKGKSQSATKLKDRTFNEMHDWMNGFFKAARICLDGDLQRLESLAKVVKD